MNVQINLNANVVVPNGPRFAVQRTISVDAYDALEFKVPKASSTDLEVELQPGNRVKFIAILSDSYGNDLTYKINDSSKGVSWKLDQPLFLAGEGATPLFDDPGASHGTPPTTLYFKNTDPNKDAEVQILIGRDATK
jgi:hypothetical protein